MKFKKVKKILALTLMISICILTITALLNKGSTKRVSAEIKFFEEVSTNIKEVENKAGVNFSAEGVNTLFLESKKASLWENLSLNAVTLDTNNIILETNGEFKFVDLIGKTKDGEYINLSAYAEWESSNEGVVSANMGRIIAEGKGEAIVTVQFQDFKEEIKVEVLENIDIEEIVKELNQPSFTGTNAKLTSMTPTERTVVVGRADKMTKVVWTPKKDLRGWRNLAANNFKKDVRYTGIPYSQTAYQTDYNEFRRALNYSDFYNLYSRFGIPMPKYGNDCSAFVSFSWGISRHTTESFLSGLKSGKFSKVGNYNLTNPTELSLHLSYYSLQKGDALIKSGHTFLAAANNQSTMKVYVYEQTPPKARYIIWDYQLLSLYGYMPFTK